MGGILCLCGGVVALKVSEGNRAEAQAEPPRPVADAAEPTPPSTPPTLKESHDEKKAAEAKADETPALPGKELVEEPKSAETKPVDEPARPLPPISRGEALSDKAKEPSPPPADLTPSPTLPSPPPLSGPPPLPAAAAVAPAPPSANELPQAKAEPKPEAPPAPPGSLEPPPPSLSAPAAPIVQVSQIGEPPLAGMGPIQVYHVRTAGETMRDIARRTLGAGERWTDVYKLNPSLHAEDSLTVGTTVHLPSDACMPADELAGLKPLPAMRPKTAPAKPKVVMALTGTYPCNIDDKRSITLPRAVRDQFGDAEVVLVSPGPDQCLWLTDPAHQERLADRLEHSPAREVDVRVFKRLYYAQTEKTPVGADGRVAVSDRLTAFAGLSQEVVLVGIDDHFEIWDAARWKQYTQLKSAVAPGSE
jgi:MraZ protein